MAVIVEKQSKDRTYEGFMDLMSVLWKKAEDKAPPDDEILLVSGPLGIDLAVRIDGHWYFKYGDTWETENLEYWHFNTPSEWTEILHLKEFLKE